jgi:hypothetical protein
VRKPSDVQDTLADRIAKWGVGAILLGAMSFFLWPILDRVNGEVTVYRMFCKTERHGGACALKEERSSSTETYKVFPERQSVIYWFNDSAPLKFDNCIVRDALNWRCASPEKSGGAAVEHLMTNGTFSELVDGRPTSSNDTFYQTPRWRWWLVRLLETTGLSPP